LALTVPASFLTPARFHPGKISPASFLTPARFHPGKISLAKFPSWQVFSPRQGYCSRQDFHGKVSIPSSFLTPARLLFPARFLRQGFHPDKFSGCTLRVFFEAVNDLG
jgi:hypothetical protein